VKRILITCTLIMALIASMVLPASASTDQYAVAAPSGIVSTGDGGYLVTDVFNKVVWKVSADGSAVQMAGRINVSDLGGEPIGKVSDGSLSTALFENPWGIAPFLDGYLVSEPDSNVIRYFDDTAVRTAVGRGWDGLYDAVGPIAQFSFPTGLAAGDNGEVYVADTGNGAIRRIAPDGSVTTVFTGLNEPTGLCWYDGALYVAETGAHCISRIEGRKRIVVAGLEDQDGYTDGHVGAALLRDPQGVAVGEDGTIYIADTGNHAVRCLRGDQMSTISRGRNAGMPRGLLVKGEVLFVTDVFARSVEKISLSQEGFEDVSADAWYESAVSESVRRGLFIGVGDGQFAPAGVAKRAMLAQTLANFQEVLDGDVVIAGSAELKDVGTDHWCGSAARWAVDGGFLTAADGVFDPAQEMTRREMVMALWRFAAFLGGDTSARCDLSEFTDADLLDGQAEEAMSWAVANGLIVGVGGNRLSPDTVATRAQMAQVMIRFMDLLQKN